MSSSSSDSEEDARLKAAAVTVTDIFTGKGAPKSEDSGQDHSRNGRYDLDPECKKFLASKLDEMLERTYKFTTKKMERSTEFPTRSEAGGVRLFSNSAPLTDVPHSDEEPSKAKKRRKKKDILPKTSATDDMLRACAVSADWLKHQNPLRKTS
ncbi:uncharacterized protein LOC108863924 [Galendromus occidentalis]|uniref:Uncharacterized protein LOC108863924 n=1 Tax=Galendromus occidentalis TaxID=34638 RepID=A0AAJ7L338_9ACAR|nr:uncharacterized protein LOC108863924 [Galendromus occidentalis]